MSLLSNYVNKQISNYINKEIETNYDPGAIMVRDEDYNKAENLIWYKARNGAELQRFYKTNYPMSGIVPPQSFYRKVKGKTPVIHVPFARLLTNTAVNLVFSEVPDLTVDTGNQKTSKELNDKITEILEENKFSRLCQDIGTYVSYSGAAAIKPIMDTDISENVILQVYPKEAFDIQKKYGRIREIIFKDFYTYDKEEYCLKSHYGIGYIHFELVKKNKEVALNSIPETEGLQDYIFVDSKGQPLKVLMAAYVDNNEEATSDYDGIIDLMETLDEIKSTELYIQRALKPRRSIPSTLCEIDKETGKTILPNDWDIEDHMIEIQDPEGVVKNMNETVFTSPDLTAYEEYAKDIIKNILNVVGLSQSTIGENDGGSNSSGLALNIREKASLRKRAALINRYDDCFKHLLKIMLMFTYGNVSGDKYISEDYDYDFMVDFSEYASPDFNDMVKTLAEAINAGLISQRYALEELYLDDIGEEGVEKMLQEIKGEKEEFMKQLTSKENPEENPEEEPEEEKKPEEEEEKKEDK